MKAETISVHKGRPDTATITVTRRGNFRSGVNLSVSGLPAGVKASFTPASTVSLSKLTLISITSSKLATSTITITGRSGGLTHTVTAPLTVTAIKKGVAVDLSSAYNGDCYPQRWLSVCAFSQCGR